MSTRLAWGTPGRRAVGGALFDLETPATASDIAAQLDRDASNVANDLKRLVTDGLVSRSTPRLASPRRRGRPARFAYTLTAAGSAALGRARSEDLGRLEVADHLVLIHASAAAMPDAWHVLGMSSSAGRAAWTLTLQGEPATQFWVFRGGDAARHAGDLMTECAAAALEVTHSVVSEVASGPLAQTVAVARTKLANRSRMTAATRRIS